MAWIVYGFFVACYKLVFFAWHDRCPLTCVPTCCVLRLFSGCSARAGSVRSEIDCFHACTDCNIMLIDCLTCPMLSHTLLSLFHIGRVIDRPGNRPTMLSMSLLSRDLFQWQHCSCANHRLSQFGFNLDNFCMNLLSLYIHTWYF